MTYICCAACNKNAFNQCSIFKAAEQNDPFLSERNFSCELFMSEYWKEKNVTFELTPKKKEN